jgi:hypothetical protein
MVISTHIIIVEEGISNLPFSLLEQIILRKEFMMTSEVDEPLKVYLQYEPGRFIWDRQVVIESNSPGQEVCKILRQTGRRGKVAIYVYGAPQAVFDIRTGEPIVERWNFPRQ